MTTEQVLISDLNPGAAALSTDFIAAMEGAAAKKLTLAQILALVIDGADHVTLAALEAWATGELNAKLALAGGTMTGGLKLSGDATDPLHAVPLGQVPQLLQTVDGSFRNLLLSADGVSSSVSIWFDQLILANASGSLKQLSKKLLSVNLALVGANALDAGTVAASSWYAIWAIYNPTTDTAASMASLCPSMTGTFTSGSKVVTGITDTTGLAAGMPVGGANVAPGSVIGSVDSSSQITLSRKAVATGSASFSYLAEPTLPTDYTHKARIGMVYTDATANKYPFPFLQVGRKVRWVPTPGSNLTSPRQMAALTSTSGYASTLAFAPLTADIISILLQPTVGSNNTFAHPNGNSGGSNSTTYPPQISQATTSTCVTMMADIFLEKASVYFSAYGGTGELFANGYEDSL